MSTSNQIHDISNGSFSVNYNYAMVVIKKRTRSDSTVAYVVERESGKIMFTESVLLRKYLAEYRPRVSKALYPQDWINGKYDERDLAIEP